MRQINLTKKYALVRYSRAASEDYNPYIYEQSDDVDYLEERCPENSSSIGYTIITRDKEGNLIDYYTKKEFHMDERS